MIISSILLTLDIDSSEIKTRFKSKQIKLNGTSIGNINIDINPNFIMEAGDFIMNFYNIQEIEKLKTWKLIGNYSIGELFGESSNVQILDNLESFHCLTISKNNHYILMKN